MAGISAEQQRQIEMELLLRDDIIRACVDLRNRLGESVAIPVLLPVYIYLQYVRHVPSFIEYLEGETSKEMALDMQKRSEIYYKMTNLDF